MGAHLARAQLLYAQDRFKLAEEELRQELAENPDDPVAHGFLALCLVELERLDEATQEAQAAVHQAPDIPFSHHVMARVMLQRNRFDDAQVAADEAVRLEPQDPDHHSLKAHLHLAQREWTRALEAADAGLEADPEHIGCINARAKALVKLGRRDEAERTLQGALARAPESSFTHANQGWALLDRSDPKKALDHFREALRLDPGNEWARRGVVEALKARNPVYALMLRYFLWMGKLTGKGQWAVIIGAYIGYRVLISLHRAVPEIQPFVFPLIILYIAFALMTWIAYPLFNLLLRLSPTGKLALTDEQRTEANWVGVCLAAALGCLGWWLAADSGLALLLLLTFALLLLPLSSIFRCSPGWPRRVMILYTLGLLAVQGVQVAVAYTFDAEAAEPILGTLSVVFLLGAFLSGFVANGLMQVRPAR